MIDVDIGTWEALPPIAGLAMPWPGCPGAPRGLGADAGRGGGPAGLHHQLTGAQQGHAAPRSQEAQGAGRCHADVLDKVFEHHLRMAAIVAPRRHVNFGAGGSEVLVRDASEVADRNSAKNRRRGSKGATTVRWPLGYGCQMA